MSQTVYRGGQPVGLIERYEERTETGSKSVHHQVARTRSPKKEPVQIETIDIREYDNAGVIVGLQHISRIDKHVMQTMARIMNDVAVITRSELDDERFETIPLPADLRFDRGAGLLEVWDPRVTPELTFRQLDIRAPAIETVVYRWVGDSDDFDNATIISRKTYVDGSLHDRLELTMAMDGEVLSLHQPMFGEAATLARSDHSNDKTSLASDTVSQSVIPSPYRIGRAARRSHIRYAFSHKSDGRFVPPTTGEQRVRTTDTGFVIDVCQRCGHGLSTREEDLRSWLAPTFWMQSDHAEIMAIAARVTSLQMSDARKMERLLEMATRHMREVDFAGHVSALAALDRRSGDCTEAAVILAALGRAAGIPTRVASGIVYANERYHGTRHVFMPHAWTLAYVDGEWQSFDLALGDFDATRIAFNVGNGDPASILAGHSLAAMVTWESMLEVRKKPAD